MMLIYLLKMFGISLAMTLMLELLTAKVIRVELSKKNVFLICLVNLLTNPPAVLLVWLGRQYLLGGLDILFEVILEIIVVLVEAQVYRRFVQEENWKIKNPLLLALVTNVVSWGVGLVLQWK